MYVLDVYSPEFAALDNWDVKQVNKNELPKLRALSDLLWVMWENTARQALMGNIKHFMVFFISNDETAPVIISRALKAVGVADGQPKVVPGMDVIVGGDRPGEHEAAEALIGT